MLPFLKKTCTVTSSSIDRLNKSWYAAAKSYMGMRAHAILMSAWPAGAIGRLCLGYNHHMNPIRQRWKTENADQDVYT
jgi:hypothetical protein